jgi:hypothetical protein
MARHVAVRELVRIPLWPTERVVPTLHAGAARTQVGKHTVALEVHVVGERMRLTPATHALFGAAGPATFVSMTQCGKAVIARATVNVLDECDARRLDNMELPVRITATALDQGGEAVAKGAVTCVLVRRGAAATTQGGSAPLFAGEVPKKTGEVAQALVTAATPPSPRKRRLNAVVVDVSGRAAAKRLFVDDDAHDQTLESLTCCAPG